MNYTYPDQDVENLIKSTNDLIRLLEGTQSAESEAFIEVCDALMMLKKAKTDNQNTTTKP